MAFQIPQELQEKLARFEQIKVQLQMIMGNRMEMENRINDLNSAIEALDSAGEGDVYKRAGDLLIKVEEAGSLGSELKEELETVEVRLKGVKSQEENLKKMYESLGGELNEALKGYK